MIQVMRYYLTSVGILPTAFYVACLLTQPGKTNSLARKDQELVAIEPPKATRVPLKTKTPEA
nr:hypothetical protein Q903MT_gene3236 [Picea sitchensis]